jgi:hypothetical protein
MIDKISKMGADVPKMSGRDMMKPMNSLLHAKPDSAYYNLISMGAAGNGFSPSKILNRPELCDNLCADIIPTLAMIQGMISAYFPTVV